MAGHSKWANIKHRKGAQDAKRAKIFTKVLREINIAVRQGGPDPDSNPALRRAIANARGVNMPKDNIMRAIKKASGKEAENYQEVTFEGYGPYGIAFIIETATDNTNRTVGIVRSIFSKNGGELGKTGSLEYIFDRKGVFVIEKEKVADRDLEELEMELIDGGAEDIETDDEFITVYTDYKDFGLMSSKLEELGIEVKNAGLQRIPKTTKTLPLEQAKKILALAEKFEDEDDVQNVYHNLELTDELLENLD
jgi:YebC/PmpR family DNA-binding regulatory protein